MNNLVAPTAEPNNPARAGQLASGKAYFGENDHFLIYAVHTRFDSVQWFVIDLDMPEDEDDLPHVITQDDDFNKAVAYTLGVGVEIRFTPIDGYIDSSPIMFTVPGMEYRGFDAEHMAWARGAKVGESKNFDSGNCTFTLERTK